MTSMAVGCGIHCGFMYGLLISMPTHACWWPCMPHEEHLCGCTGGLNIALIIHIMQVGPDKMKAYIEGLDRNTTYRCVCVCVFFRLPKKSF